jgi:hypothetical protein
MDVLRLKNIRYHRGMTLREETLVRDKAGIQGSTPIETELPNDLLVGPQGIGTEHLLLTGTPPFEGGMVEIPGRGKCDKIVE